MPEHTNDDVLLFNRIFIMYDKNSNMTEGDFEELFHSFGTIEQVHISKEQAQGTPKGVCYIRFEKTSEACLAVEEMNNKEMAGQRKRLKVHIAHDRRGSLEIDVDLDKMLQRLFVNHPKEASAEEVKHYFGDFGEVIWMYQLKDKNTGVPRGSAFIKYELQSQAAMALEACNSAMGNNYRARWADVRKADPDKPRQRHGVSVEMAGGSRHMGERGGGRGGGGGHGMGGADNMDMEPMSFAGNHGHSGNMGPKVLEALVPKVLSNQQIYRLFDIAPGLQNINQDQMSGMVTCQYGSPSDAAYAKGKLDGLELYGQVIAVRFAKVQSHSGSGFQDPTVQLQETLRNMQGGSGASGGNIQALVQSLQQVTKVISHSGMGGGGGGGGVDPFDYEPVSSVRLPSVKPLVSEDSPVANKVFFNSTPPSPAQLLPNEVLVNICCRFGNLISVRWVQGKRFGFAAYAQNSSALAAVNKLNGAIIDDNTLKVEMAKSKDSSDRDGPFPQKRPRQF